MNLTSTDLLALLPLFIVGLTTLGVMGGIAWKRHHFFSATLTVVGLNLALVSLIPVWYITPEQVTPLLLIDGYSVFYMAMALISALACSTLAHAYLSNFPDRREEFYLLLMCSVAGALTLVSANHMASLFIGLELLSVPLYGMVAYTFRDSISLEGAIKYMVLSGAASATLLFGMALIYAVSGSLEFRELAVYATSSAPSTWLIIGVGMMVIAFGFKLSLAPFHLWTPDVYEGAPGPASAYLATVSKLAAFAVLMRFFIVAPSVDSGWLLDLIAAIAFISMIAGNVLALRQSNIKRLLGYSSIAHLGYLLTMIAASEGVAVEAAGVYLATYIATMLGAFGVVTLVSSPYRGPDAASLHNYRGLFWRRPYLASVLTIMMISLAGIPMTAGFIGKVYALATSVQSDLWWLTAGIIVGSAIGLHYYMRVAITLFLREPGEVRRDAERNWGQRSGGIMVWLLAIAVLFMGIYPQPLIAFIKAAGIGS